MEFMIDTIFDLIDSTVGCLKAQLASLSQNSPESVSDMIMFIEDNLDGETFKEGSTEAFMKEILILYRDKKF